MAQQDKQMRAGVREGFAYHSVILVLLANSNRYEVDSLLIGKVLYPFKVLFCSKSDFFDTHLRCQFST